MDEPSLAIEAASDGVRSSRLFRYMSDDQRARSIAASQAQKIRKGEQIVQARDFGGDIFIIEHDTLLAK